MTGITREENGTYVWNGTIDARYEHKTFRILFTVIGPLCIIFIMMGLTMGDGLGGVMILTSLGIMAVVGGVCFLFNLNAGNRKQAYAMNEDCVVFGVGKASNPFFYKSIRKAVVYTNRNMIELYTLVGSGPVFADHRDFGFVRDYIIQRLPESAKVIYE